MVNSTRVLNDICRAQQSSPPQALSSTGKLLKLLSVETNWCPAPYGDVWGLLEAPEESRRTRAIGRQILDLHRGTS
jgi:hypothetical protein